MLDTRQDRLDFCRDAIGVDHVVSAGPDARERLGALTSGDFFDCVFDCTGSAKAMNAGFLYVAHGGAYVLVSIVLGEISFADPEFHKRETTLFGSRNATRADFDAVFAMLRAGKIPTARLNTHRASLEQAPGRISSLARALERRRQSPHRDLSHGVPDPAIRHQPVPPGAFRSVRRPRLCRGSGQGQNRGRADDVLARQRAPARLLRYGPAVHGARARPRRRKARRPRGQRRQHRPRRRRQRELGGSRAAVRRRGALDRLQHRRSRL